MHYFIGILKNKACTQNLMGTDKKYCKGGNIIGWYKEPKNIMCKKGGGLKLRA